jgi:hypothetical protein
VTVFEWNSGEPFFLADDTGRVLVKPNGAEFEIRTQKASDNLWSSLAQNQIERIVAFARAQGSNFDPGGASWLWRKEFRVSEGIIAAGAPLYALGHFRTTAADEYHRPAAGLRLFLERAFYLKRHPVTNTLDLDRNGKICFDEWYAAFTKTAVAAGGGFAEAPLALPRGMHDDSKCYGTLSTAPGQKLYLADCHQAELIHRIGSWNLARVIGGAILVTAGILALAGYIFFRAR